MADLFDAVFDAQPTQLDVVHRDALHQWWQRQSDSTLTKTIESLAPEASQWRALIASEFVRRVLAAQPDRAVDILHNRPEALAEQLPWNQHDAVAQHLRRWRARQMARLAVAEMGGQLTLSECLSGLSQLADTAVLAALHSARAQMRQRYGCLRAAGGNEVPLVVIAMGKLGGDELNFSSDIDILFAFPEAGCSDGERAVEAPEYCLREARLVIDLLDRMTADGRVFRVDTRLRPFGDAGPLAISFAALEDYLQRQGRDWERYAFVKARFLATTDVPAVAQFQDSVVRPFV
ncbi:MAG: bifunctional glutamine synthetase adenylyltransferase/deadenyltransferase, partial [Pseudomonadota bacterium]